MIAWVKCLVLHTGRYGGGDVGVIKKGVFFVNLRQLTEIEPALFILTVYYAVVLIVVTLRRPVGVPEGLRRVLLAGCVAILIEILLIVRQAAAAHYLLPCEIAVLVVNTI